MVNDDADNLREDAGSHSVSNNLKKDEFKIMGKQVARASHSTHVISPSNMYTCARTIQPSLRKPQSESTHLSFPKGRALRPLALYCNRYSPRYRSGINSYSPAIDHTTIIFGGCQILLSSSLSTAIERTLLREISILSQCTLR